jgi:4-hydroxy-3-polyprenylbenzoate decarboxylase
MSKIIVGISGATGVIYGVRMLKVLHDAGVETHLVITQSAINNLHIETELKISDLEAMATVVYDVDDVAAPYRAVPSKWTGWL